MKLIIGLGNPGTKYLKNRHNAGYLFVEYTIENCVLQDKDCRLMKTDTFMNDSGSFVKKKINQDKMQIADMILVHDDLDIPLGKFKFQFGVGPKVHNGVESVERQLGTKDFWRMRIGVDNRDPENRTPGEQYVLRDFTRDEFKILDGLFKEASKKLLDKK